MAEVDWPQRRDGMSWRISSGPFTPHASSQCALLVLLDRAEEVGLRLLDGAEKIWLRLLVEGGIAGMAAHDSAEEVWLRHCAIVFVWVLVWPESLGS